MSFEYANNKRVGTGEFPAFERTKESKKVGVVRKTQTLNNTIEVALKKFDEWMKLSDEGTHATELVEWLAYKGGKRITNYEEFIELASQLNRKGYNIPEAPSKFQFEKGMLRFSYRFDKSFEASKEARIAFSLEQFDRWMRGTLPHNGTHVEELVEWLYDDHGGMFITNYEEFVQLSTQLRGYDIPVVPSKIQFEMGMLEFAKRTGYQLSTETIMALAKETRMALALEKFVDWMRVTRPLN